MKPFRRARSRDGAGRDAGFSLIETIVGLSILSMVLTAAVPFIVGVLQATAGLGSKQTALSVASQQLEYTRSVLPSQLLTGRNANDVAALVAAPGLVDLSADITGSLNSDPTAAAGSASATVPLTSVQTISSVAYTVRTYIDACYLAVGGTCTAGYPNGSLAYRVSVDVAWPRSQGVRCASGRAGYCEYVATTLIDSSDDPVFSSSQPPTITSCSASQGGTQLPGLHPGQLVNLQVGGTNFAAGAVLYSSNGDTMGAVSANTGTSVTAPLQISGTLGTRTIVVVNPDGSTVSQSLTVATSTPGVTGMSPGTAARTVAKTFTLTGTDFFATPSNSSATKVPTVSLTGWSTFLGIPVLVVPIVAAVSVTSPTSLTFTATFPWQLYGYTTTGTLTLTNPDGGTDTYSYSVAVS